LVGAISYGKVFLVNNEEGKNPEKNPAAFVISYLVPPPYKVIIVRLLLHFPISVFLVGLDDRDLIVYSCAVVYYIPYVSYSNLHYIPFAA
jgi:hypothetical protein